MNIHEAKAEVKVNHVAEALISNLKAAIRKSPTGVSFVSLKNYESTTSGEVADITINVGVSYFKAGEKDVKTLENTDLTKLSTDEFSVVDLEIARTALINSILKPSKNHSNAQKDAYTIICEGLKVHNKEQEIHIFAQAVSKNVIVKGEYKTVYSRHATLVKNYLTKQLDLRRAKFRNYKLSNLQGLKVNGVQF